MFSSKSGSPRDRVEIALPGDHESPVRRHGRSRSPLQALDLGIDLELSADPRPARGEALSLDAEVRIAHRRAGRVGGSNDQEVARRVADDLGLVLAAENQVGDDLLRRGGD